VEAIALAFGASVAWGASDFAGGLVTQRLPLRAVLLGAQLGGLVVALAAWIASGARMPSPGAAAAGALAGGFGVLGFACLYRGLARGAMGVVAPLAALGAVVPVGLSVARGDAVALPTALGAAVALLGSAACAREAGRRHLAEGALLGLGAALCFGVFFAALGTAAASGGPAAVTASRVSAIAVLLAVGAVRRVAAGDRRVRTAGGALAAVGALDAVADLGYAAACANGVHAGPAVVASLYPLTTVLLARLLLHEHLDRGRWAGIAAVLGGIALISAG
jgi:drug/metabolite transporter (DMT)-like permease